MSVIKCPIDWAQQGKMMACRTQIKVIPPLAVAHCCFVDSLSACLPQETLLDRRGQHQHGQHRRQQPQHPLLQPKRPCGWVPCPYLFVWPHEEQHTLVTEQLITHPNLCFPGLSIDFDTEQLYWISSGNSTINRCKLDGSGLEVLEGVKGKLTKATALAIMGRFPEKKRPF